MSHELASLITISNHYTFVLFHSLPLDHSSNISLTFSFIARLSLHYFLSQTSPTLALLKLFASEAAMATSKISATVLILSLLLFAFFTTSSAQCPPKTNPIIPKPKPKPKPLPSPKGPPANPFCPRDTLKLGVCADLLGAVNVIIGTPPDSKCCALLEGLTNLEAAACLCTAIKANVLGINLNIPVSLSAIVTGCGKKVPTGFKCG